MEFIARQEGRIADSIFLHVHPEVLAAAGVMFTRDVSNKKGVTLHSLEEAKDMIDFEVLYTRTDWRDPKINDSAVTGREVRNPCTGFHSFGTHQKFT